MYSVKAVKSFDTGRAIATTCNVYRANKKIAEVFDDGRSIRMNWDVKNKDLHKEFLTYIGDNFEGSEFGMGVAIEDDWVLNEIEMAEIRKNIRNILKKNTVFLANNTLKMFSVKYEDNKEKIFNKLSKDYSDFIILNELPEDKAVKIYLKYEK